MNLGNAALEKLGIKNQKELFVEPELFGAVRRRL
jgi:hypothetical protein